MATYYVYSGAAGTNSGADWTNAYTAFGSAVTAATTDGDIIKVHYTHQEELGVDTTYTFGADIFVVAVNKDSSDAPTAMGTGGWIGNSTTNRAITVSGADLNCYAYGITYRTAGSTSDTINLNAGIGATWQYESCYVWSGNTATAARIRFNTSTSAERSTSTYVNCTFRFGNTSQGFEIDGDTTLIGCNVSSDGSTPTTLFASTGISGTLRAIGCDFSLVTGTLIGNMGYTTLYSFERCKFGSGVTVLASQTTNPTKSSGRAFVSDCHNGDTHMTFGYYDATGSVVQDTAIYYTTGAAALSWKIVTTANATARTPFETPWIDLYNTGTSSITPYFEILRDGSATAYKDHEVWADFTAKTSTGVTTATLYTDRCSVTNLISAGGSNQAAGAGTGSWTGEGGTAWSGKCDSGSAFTPAEIGYIRGRIVVAAASTTVYVDPQIRT